MMLKKQIIMSAYSCDPVGISESKAAYNFLEVLVSKYSVLLVTTRRNETNIRKYGKVSLDNLSIISFADIYPFRSNKIVHESLKLGYFIFNIKIWFYFFRNKHLIEKSDLLYHKSPSGFRYITSLRRFNKPLVVGPTGGGLHPPKVMREYFGTEHFVFKLRGMDNIIMSSTWFSNYLNSIDKILITLPYVREVLGDKYREKYIELFDTGIDTSKCSPDFNMKRDLRVLYVGKLTRYKGAELLIRAVSLIRHIDFTVDIYGDGEERKSLKKIAENLGVQNVVFHGHVSRDVIQDAYLRASLFCFPSITEASGNALLEAMSYALPIITVNNGGPKYMCPDDGSIKIDIDEPEKMVQMLASALSDLLSDSKRCESMGNSNRSHCVEHYDWKVIRKKILNFFDKQLN